MTGVSEKFRRVTREEASALSLQLGSAWQHPEMPDRQWVRVAREEVERFRNGERQKVFAVLLEMLNRIPKFSTPPLVAEIGAASGYYSEILKLGGFDCEYTGVDYSEHFQRLAWSLYPEISFQVADARHLPFPDRLFDIVISGCCLTHIFDYRAAIAEAARVSDGWVVLHRTPFVMDGPTRFFVKEAYGVECLEIHFAQEELVNIFVDCGLSIVDQADIFTDLGNQYGHTTMLLRRS